MDMEGGDLRVEVEVRPGDPGDLGVVGAGRAREVAAPPRLVAVGARDERVEEVSPENAPDP